MTNQAIDALRDLLSVTTELYRAGRFPAEPFVRGRNVLAEAERNAAGERGLGWLIERGSAPLYWAGSHDWNRDHTKAIRFARRVDAERVCDAQSMRGKWDPRVVEHVWLGGDIS